jgi:hypothetical protein
VQLVELDTGNKFLWSSFIGDGKLGNLDEQIKCNGLDFEYKLLEYK